MLACGRLHVFDFRSDWKKFWHTWHEKFLQRRSRLRDFGDTERHCGPVHRRRRHCTPRRSIADWRSYTGSGRPVHYWPVIWIGRSSLLSISVETRESFFWNLSFYFTFRLQCSFPHLRTRLCRRFVKKNFLPPIVSKLSFTWAGDIGSEASQRNCETDGSIWTSAIPNTVR